MNVLESLNMVSRLAKNRYTWHGRAQLARTLALLQREGEKHHYSQQIQQIRQRHAEDVLEMEGEEKENEDPDGEILQRESNFSEASIDAKGGQCEAQSFSLRGQSTCALYILTFYLKCCRGFRLLFKSLSVLLWLKVCEACMGV